MLTVAPHVTPFMMPLAYTGAILLLLGLIGLMIWIFYGWGTKLLRFSARLLIPLGVFFLACEVAWILVALEPSIDFGDASAFLADKKPFWLFGFGFLISGFFMRIVGALRPTH